MKVNHYHFSSRILKEGKMSNSLCCRSIFYYIDHFGTIPTCIHSKPLKFHSEIQWKVNIKNRELDI